MDSHQELREGEGKGKGGREGGRRKLGHIRSDEHALNLLLLAAPEQVVGLLELLNQELTGVSLEPAGVMRLVEGILDGDGALSVHRPVDALVDSDDAVALVLLPKVIGVVLHETSQHLDVVAARL
jgi:hypothetical protein